MKLAIIAAAVTVVAAFSAFVRMWYCMWKKSDIIKPNFLTWGVWAILAIVLFKSEWEAVGSTWVLSLLINDLVCINITALVLLILVLRRFIKPKSKKSKPKFWFSDWCQENLIELACLFGIGAVSVTWFLTAEPILALLCYLAIDFIAVVPTLFGVWEYHHNEDTWEWVGFQISNTAVILTVERFTWEQLAYPLVVCAIALSVNIVRILSWWRSRKYGE